MEQYRNNADMQDLAHATAHLIHGSSEGRFKITYAPGHLTKAEIEGVNFGYADIDETIAPLSPRQVQARLEHNGRRRADSSSSPRPPPACGPRAKNCSTAPADLPSETAQHRFAETIV